MDPFNLVLVGLRHIINQHRISCQISCKTIFEITEITQV